MESPGVTSHLRRDVELCFKKGRKQGRMDVNLLPAWALHFSEIGSVKFEPNVPSFFDLGVVP